MLDFCDDTTTGISILTSVADLKAGTHDWVKFELDFHMNLTGFLAFYVVHYNIFTGLKMERNGVDFLFDLSLSQTRRLCCKTTHNMFMM